MKCALASKSVDADLRVEKTEAPPAERSVAQSELDASLVESSAAQQKIGPARAGAGHTMDTLGWKKCALP
jgi:hypothetical protein